MCAQCSTFVVFVRLLTGVVVDLFFFLFRLLLCAMVSRLCSIFSLHLPFIWNSKFCFVRQMSPTCQSRHTTRFDGVSYLIQLLPSLVRLEMCQFQLAFVSIARTLN